MIVSTSGDFVRVDDLQSLRTGLRKLFAPLLTKDAPPAAHAIIESALTDEVLTRSVAQEWHLLVGAWRGLPLTGEKHESHSEEAVPTWPDVKVPMRITTGMVERTECTRGGVRHHCVVFELQSVVERAGMERLIEKMMKVTGVQTAGGRYDRFDVVNTGAFGSKWTRWSRMNSRLSGQSS